MPCISESVDNKDEDSDGPDGSDSTSTTTGSSSLSLEESVPQESQSCSCSLRVGVEEQRSTKKTMSGYSRMENEINLRHLIKLMQIFHVRLSWTKQRY